MNLPPIMGRRDAVLDAAEALLQVVRQCRYPERGQIFSHLHKLFSEAEFSTERIRGMFNNSDTAAREKRLSTHIGILSKLAGALDDFCLLRTRMLEAVSFYAGDQSGEFDEACSARIDSRMSEVEHRLLDQLCEYFQRVRERIFRYRQYAVKSFSKEYLECYRKSYSASIRRCGEAFEPLSVKIIPTQTDEVISR